MNRPVIAIYTALQRQKAVSAYFTVSRYCLLPFAFARQYRLVTVIILISAVNILYSLTTGLIEVIYRLVKVLSSNPGRAGCLSTGFAYTVLQTVQRLGVWSPIHSTLHYKESLKSFDKSRA